MSEYSIYVDHERCLAWQLAVKLAEWQGITAGIVDTNEKDTIFAIRLPSGDIEIIVDTKEVYGKWKAIDRNSLDNKVQGWGPAVKDCLDGILIHRHTLIIPEQKEETE